MAPNLYVAAFFMPFAVIAFILALSSYFNIICQRKQYFYEEILKNAENLNRFYRIDKAAQL